MVEFAGWSMPLHYGSQMDEHQQVRSAAGCFDVSHMVVWDVEGAAAEALLLKLVANDVGRLKDVGAALYGVLLNDAGGVIDDLIAYRRDAGFRVVTNAGTRDRVISWVLRHAREVDAVVRVRDDLGIIAVQGPAALDRYAAATGASVTGVETFTCVESEDVMTARTGYTGEDGVEVILPREKSVELWQALVDVGVAPIGLAARDTLRLEAGLNLSGQDMDESVNPLEAGLGWTVAWEPASRQFVGREAVEALREGRPAQRLVGLVLEDKGVMRAGLKVATAQGDGIVTSGIFSPTLGYSIALARVPRRARGACEVEIRDRRKAARIVKPPFVRNGQQVFE